MVNGQTTKQPYFFIFIYFKKMKPEAIPFIAISAFLLLSYFIGNLFSKIKQPQVISEISVGILLGPAVFGMIYPDLFNTIFNPTTLQSLGTLKELGLILLMFCS